MGAFKLLLLFWNIVGTIICNPVTKNGSALDDIAAVNEQHNGLFHVVETDIKYTPNEMTMMHEDIQHAVMKDKTKRWPGGVLHFTISNSFSSSEKAIIRDAVTEIGKNTCVKLIEHPLGSAPTNHVAVYPGSGCWSYIGVIGGSQDLSLQSNGCVYKGTIIHEFLHALGFYHEQSRTDRDDYIGINWANIQSGLESNFEIRDGNNQGVEYNPKSIMHYSNYAFSKNNQMTIYWKKDPTVSLGGREFSPLDILQLNLFYECNAVVTTKSTTTTGITKTPTVTATKTTTNTNTPSATTITATKTPTKTTTTRSTTTLSTLKTTLEPRTTAIGCGDRTFKCVRAYYNPTYYCLQTFYKDNCPQSCGQCGNRDKIICINFQDNHKYNCKEMQKNGDCTNKDYSKRLEMKQNCSKTCCMEGRLYN